MKVCVIGNSHAVSLKSEEAYRAGFDFLIVPGGGAPSYRMQEGRLRVKAPANRSIYSNIDGAAETGIDLTAYDALVYSAVGLWPADNAALQRPDASHPLALMSCPDWASEEPGASHSTRPLVSKAVFRRCVEARLRQHDTVSSCIRIADLFDGPVFVQPMPPPSVALGSDPNWALTTWYGSRGAVAWREYFLSFRLALAEVLKEHAPKISQLSYPQNAIVSDGFLGLNYWHYDNWHASKNYGKFICDEIIAKTNVWLKARNSLP